MTKIIFLFIIILIMTNCYKETIVYPIVTETRIGQIQEILEIKQKTKTFGTTFIIVKIDDKKVVIPWGGKIIKEGDILYYRVEQYQNVKIGKYISK